MQSAAELQELLQRAKDFQNSHPHHHDPEGVNHDIALYRRMHKYAIKPSEYWHRYTAKDYEYLLQQLNSAWHTLIAHPTDPAAQNQVQILTYQLMNAIVQQPSPYT